MLHLKNGSLPALEINVLYFDSLDREPDHSTLDSPEHGRIETRCIWVTTTALSDDLHFPHVGQAFMVERITLHKKSGKQRRELAYGTTSITPDLDSAAQVLRDNREHWSIENSCHYIIDWNYDEDRSRIRKAYGPENMTHLRRFAVGVIKSKGVSNVAQKMHELTLNTRMVFDYLIMTRNTCLTSTG